MSKIVFRTDTRLGIYSMAFKSLLEEVLRKQKGLEGLEIHEVNEVPCTKPGDNYMSVVSLVEIKGHLPGAVAYNDSVFVKRQPEGQERRQIFQTEVAFNNEAVMYESVLPIYDDSVACARSLHTTRDVIILENLRAAGYEMVDRCKGFDMSQSTLVLKALARFHGASYHSLIVRREQYTSAVTQLKMTGFMISAHREMLESSMRRVIRHLQGQDVDEAVFFMKGLQGRFSEHLQSLRNPKDLKVLCHGDFWVNNILIREGNDPVKIVDLQTCAILSPAVDVWSFLYTSVNPSIMESVFPQLLRTYCTAFQEELSNFKVPSENIPSTANVMNELTYREQYGFLVSMMYIPALILSDDSIPDLDTIPRDVYLDDNFMDQFTNSHVKDRLRYTARFAKKRGLFNTQYLVDKTFPKYISK